MSRKAGFCAVLVAMALSGCDEQAETILVPSGDDPVVAKALTDPLMVDPDLAYRNEANAALTIGFDHALPPFQADAEAAQRAREEARLILLEDSQIQDLPDLNASVSGASLVVERGDAIAMARVHSVPQRCIDGLSEGYEWAARMPDVAQIMPHGQVYQAAGSGDNACNLRIVTYLTPVEAEDALEWHYNLAARANLNISLFAEPEIVMQAGKRETNTIVHASDGPNGMTAIDLFYWID